MSENRTFISASEAEPPFFMGVDLGGTNIKTGLVDNQGRSLAWNSVPTLVDDGPDAAIQRMSGAVDRAIADAKIERDQVQGVGLGSPGPMDVPGGRLLEPVNLKSWGHYPIRDELKKAIGFPVIFTNDANAAAYGEYWVGSGKNYTSMIFFTLGTGVGGGIIIGDLIIDGHNSHGSELGHVRVDSNPDARVCSCDQLGHIEAYASANGLLARTRDALAAGQASTLNAIVERGEELTPILISQEAEKGDQLALDLILEGADYLGLGAADIAHVIDPEAVIIGGAMTWGRDTTEVGRQFLARLKKVIKANVFPAIGENIIVRYADLGGDAGYIGAAGRARLVAKQKQSK